MERERERWREMIAACNDPSFPAYNWNGRLGVSIDPRWLVFENFIEDLGPMPGYNSYLDREPGTDCFSIKSTKWRTTKEKILTLNGVTKTVSQWSAIKGIPKATIDSRIRKNLPVQAVLWPAKLHTKNIEGRRFGMLLVISPVFTKGKIDLWKCKCDCGSIVNLASSLLLSNKIRSCGCVSSKLIPNTYKPTNNSYKGTRRLSRLTGIPEATLYHRRKLNVSPVDMKSPLPLQRGKIYEYDGLALTLEQWAAYLNTNVSALRTRLYNGWSFEDTIRIPIKK